jgi:hypothetical protein
MATPAEAHVSAHVAPQRPRVCRVVTPEWLAWTCMALLCAGGIAGTTLLTVQRSGSGSGSKANKLRIGGVVCAFVALISGIHADAFFRGRLWSGACTPTFRAGMLASETLTALFIIAWTVIAIVALAR